MSLFKDNSILPVRIYFKSGAILDLKVKKFKVQTNLNNEILKIEWELPEDAGKLLYISLSDIDCVIQLP